MRLLCSLIVVNQNPEFYERLHEALNLLGRGHKRLGFGIGGDGRRCHVLPLPCLKIKRYGARPYTGSAWGSTALKCTKLATIQKMDSHLVTLHYDSRKWESARLRSGSSVPSLPNGAFYERSNTGGAESDISGKSSPPFRMQNDENGYSRTVNEPGIQTEPRGEVYSGMGHFLTTNTIFLQQELHPSLPQKTHQVHQLAHFTPVALYEALTRPNEAVQSALTAMQSYNTANEAAEQEWLRATTAVAERLHHLRETFRTIQSVKRKKSQGRSALLNSTPAPLEDEASHGPDDSSLL